MAEALNVKRHQLRRALSALRANGEIAPAEAKRKPLVGHNGENLVRDDQSDGSDRDADRYRALPCAAGRTARLAVRDGRHRARRRRPLPAPIAGAADLKFHKLIAASSGNKLAASLYGLLRRVASDARVRLNASRPACPKRTQAARCRASRYRASDPCARSGRSGTGDAAASRGRAEARDRAAQSTRRCGLVLQNTRAAARR